jgi:hypothetical protein
MYIFNMVDEIEHFLQSTLNQLAGRSPGAVVPGGTEGKPHGKDSLTARRRLPG